MNWMHRIGVVTCALALCGGMMAVVSAPAVAEEYLSHPPLRMNPSASERAMADGPGYFVDAGRGDDANDGSSDAPWQSVNHALGELEPGDTLYLREGVYYENVYCSVAGTEDAPITIRAYPGEEAILDGGLRAFAEEPEASWEPYEGDDAAPGEYRSTRRFRNIRDVVGKFGDSMIGLQTYWHAKDLRAENELSYVPDGEDDLAPVYCGPGIWYDQQTGYIHARLAHTNLPRTVRLDYPVEIDFDPGASNYRGVTDPREVPLVLAPFDAVPLHVSGARNVRFQDLVIRGGGYDTVKITYAHDIELDNVTVRCGTYGLRSKGGVGVRFHNSALYGSAPPWQFRGENSLRSYRVRDREGRPQRDIVRLAAHGVLVMEGGEESQVYFYPRNIDWEISNSEFTDGFNGVFLAGYNIHFHNNRIDNFSDDAMFLSSPTPYATGDVYIYQNLTTRALMGYSLASNHTPTDGEIYFTRNIVDLRQGVNRSRPSRDNPDGTIESLLTFKLRTPEIESMYIYNNTFIADGGFGHGAIGHTTADSTRRVFNNVFVYPHDYGGLRRAPAGEADAQMDRNLHFAVEPSVEPPTQPDVFERINTSPLSKHNREALPDGFEANALVGDPGFRSFSADAASEADYRITEGSPAAGAGRALPRDWFDPLDRIADESPDIGAYPVGAGSFHFGRLGPPRE